MVTAWVCTHERMTFRLNVGGKALLKVFERCYECQEECSLTCLRDLFLNNHLLSVLDFPAVPLKKILINNHIS